MKQKLLLHACCGPCATFVIESLKDEFDISVFFYNPNIYPAQEYEKRLSAIKKFCDDKKVHLIEGNYNHEGWLNMVKGLENEPEGGERCVSCFELRLCVAADFASENGFDIFTTTLSVSPHKNFKSISQIGKELEKECGIRFLDRDFKKDDGFKRSIELSKEHSLYRQDYCGCEFALKK